MELAIARQLICETLRGWGYDAELTGERLLLRDRHYVGKRFEYEGGSAVWLADADEIKFYDSDGAFLKTVGGNEEPQSMRRAA